MNPTRQLQLSSPSLQCKSCIELFGAGQRREETGLEHPLVRLHPDLFLKYLMGQKAENVQPLWVPLQRTPADTLPSSCQGHVSYGCPSISALFVPKSVSAVLKAPSDISRHASLLWKPEAPGVSSRPYWALSSLAAHSCPLSVGQCSHSFFCPKKNVFLGWTTRTCGRYHIKPLEEVYQMEARECGKGVPLRPALLQFQPMLTCA